MTVSLRLTAARLALLRAVADGRVWHNGSGTTERVNELYAHGLVYVPPSPSWPDPQPYALTAAGRQILNQHKKETSR